MQTVSKVHERKPAELNEVDWKIRSQRSFARAAAGPKTTLQILASTGGFSMRTCTKTEQMWKEEKAIYLDSEFS